MARASAHRACDDFHRASEATRRGFLGDGLTRRQVIGRGLAGGLAVYAARAMPLSRMLEAAGAEAAGAPNAPVLVSVFLGGGCDLLDTLPPLAQLGRYADLRNGVRPSALPGLAGVSDLAHHAALARGVNGGIAGLFAAGKVGFLPGIDYANPDLSHFHSRHFWETGLITQRQAPGWLGRWLDHHGSSANPLQGVSSSYDLSPVMRSARAPVAAVASPGDAQMWWRDVWGASEKAANHAWKRASAGGARNEALAAARTAGRLAQAVAVRLRPYQETAKGGPLAPKVAYPSESDFGDRLRHLAAMIDLPLGVRVATVEAPGDFDTHDNQPEELGKVLGEVSEGLASFQADLEARGVADRVLTFVWSEFGRRPEANESQGTDHGAGGIAWVQGTRARGGILTDYPSLKRLDHDGNLAVTVDFRRVYASLIEQWLGTDAGEVIPGAKRLGRLAVVR
jgi:uncharacterized protein (DUF1501 family)